ncbi:minor tail protein [Arthrobacter phage SilentRX]|uniref:Minor tail protein n=1 Tax=Arthrobacter phage SilentRX TaxID=2836091 RepID=A0A8F3INK9_9CAUD|nr:minor tail protein [Arthrobacter phage SilentRX]QWY82775.1 minor tail protein [Arthrobacter phage SilentRX]
MVEHAPRDMEQWMRSIERRLEAARRGASSIPFSYNEQLRGDILADKLRHPTAPVEVTFQTSFYSEPGLSKPIARIDVDFPDVTKATDGSDIPIMEYELWGRDDTTNYLEATTSAVAGLAAPGLTFPGLANTQAMRDKAAKALAPFRRLTVSQASSLRADKLKPGSVWTFKVRAIGRYTVDPGEFSPEFQAQMISDVIPPPQPTVPKLSASHGTITIEWDGLSVAGAMPGDFSHLVVAWGPDAAPLAEGARFFRRGLWVVSDLDYYAPLHVRFQAVDYSGNTSPWSEEAVAFTKPLVDTDVILSELDGNKTKIRNVAAEALADGAVRKEKLADGAIALEKLDDQVRTQVQSGVDAMAALEPLQLEVSGNLARLATAENDLDASEGRLTAAEGQLTDAFGQLNTVDSRIAAAKQAAIDSGATYTDEQAKQALIDAMAANAYTLNPSFDDWTGAAPAGFSNFGTGPDKETGVLWAPGPYSARFNCTDTTTSRGLNTGSGFWRAAPNMEYWTVELVVRLVSGSTFSGMGVRIDWAGMTNNRAIVALKDEVPAPEVGKWYRVSKTVQRPTNATGTFTGMGGYLMVNYSGDNLGALSIKDVVVDWFNIRPATAEEINAGKALTMAGSKSRVYYNTSPASGAATADGDLWRQRDAQNNVIAEWRWDASLPTPAWVKTAISSEAISNLDVGKLTAGSATILDVVAQKIAASTASFQTVDVRNLFATSGTMDSAVITKLWADVVNSQKITTTMLTVGAFDNLVENPSFEDGGNRWGTYTQAYWTFPKTGGNTGTGVCRFSGITTRQLGPVSTMVPHEQGDSYRISGWVKTTATTGHTGELCLYWYNASGAYVGTSNMSITTATSAWQRFNFTYTPPDTARFVAVRVNATIANAADEYFFDDIALTRATSGELLIDGSVTANKVAANAITAKNIVVGDFQNVAIGSDFEDAAAIPWNLHPNHARSTTQKKFGTASLRLAPETLGATKASYFNGDFRVREGEQWYFNFWAYIDAGFDGDGNSKLRVASNSVGGTHLLSISYNGIPRSTWTQLEGTLTVPAGTTSLSVMLWSTNGAGYAYIDDVQFRRVAEPSLIQSLGVEKLTATSATMSQAVIDKLWADVVNAKKITTDMMVISSGTNAFADPQIKDADGWNTPYFSATGGMSGGGSINIPMNTSQSGAYYAQGGTLTNRRTRLVAGGTYRLSGWVKTSAAAPANSLQLYLRYQSDGSSSGSLAQNVVTEMPWNLTPTVANTWTFISGMVKIPDNTASLGGVLGVYKQTNYTTGTTIWSDLAIQQAAAGELIVDGAITATHLGVDSVTANAIKALEIGADKLKANAIESDKIKGGAVTADKLESTLVLATTVVAGDPDGIHAEMDDAGFKVYGVREDLTPYETVRMGVSGTDDLFAISDSTGTPTIQADPDGTFSALSVEAANSLYYKGEELSSYVGSRPRGMAAWSQVPVNTANMSVSAGNEVGLFELAWDGGDSPARMYEFVLNEMLVYLNGAGTAGLRLRFTDDGTAPTVNSQLIQYNYQMAHAAGYVGLGLSRLIGSNNGNYLRVLVCLYAAGAGATVYGGNNYLYSRVMDLGESIDPTGVATTGGGTPASGGSTVASPVVAKVTKTVEYGYTSVRSYLPSGGQYNYNTSKAYQGPSPAGYGNLQAQYGFNQNFQSLLSGATINGIWVYLYYEHWYYNAGGTAMIRLHNNLTVPSTNTGMTSNGVNSGSWPKGAGRWVALPSSLWAGFASGAYRGFGIVGDGTYNTYGIANNARIRIKYTK